MSNILEVENLHCVILPLDEVVSGKVIKSKLAIDFVQDQAANCNSLACMVKNQNQILILFDNEKDSDNFYNIVYFHFSNVDSCVLDSKKLQKI